MKTRQPPFRVVSAPIAVVLSLSALGMFLSQVCPCQAGTLRREVYMDVAGLNVAELTNNLKFPDQPDLVDFVNEFETPSQYGDNYGQRLTGFLFPPVTGDYVFFIASDDQSVLYLSSDTDPARMTQIACEPGWSGPRTWTGLGGGRTSEANISSPVRLEAGRAYYVEALHKEGWGGDNFGVAWQLPGGSPPENGAPPIPGEYLGTNSSAMRPPVVALLAPTNGAVVRAGTDLLLSAWAADYDGAVASVQFFAGQTLLGQAAGPTGSPTGNYLLTWSNVPAGVVSLTAQAIDNSGLIATSPPVQVSVVANGGPPDLGFDLAFFNNNSASSDGQVFFRHYTLSGPAEGRTLLPGMRVVPDAGGRFFYAAHPHVALKVDSQTGTATEMHLAPGLPELSWPTGMAFDSTRNRELLVSFGGEGYLYGYAPDLDRWSVVSSMSNYDLWNLVYHAPQDSLYGLGVFAPVLYRFSAQGVYQGEFPLPGLPNVGISGNQGELVSVGDYLVLLIGPDVTQPPTGRSDEWWIYVFDPRTGELRLSWHEAHRPANAAPGAVLTAPVDGAQVTVGTTVQLLTEAYDSDGTVATLELFANNRCLGLGAREPDGREFRFSWTPTSVGSVKLQALATDDDGRICLSAPVRVRVTLPAPVLTWPAPEAVYYGTALGSAQLNAVADMPGGFAYAPAAGTILSAGDHTLSVVFTPSDSAYLTVTGTVSLHVERTELGIQADNKVKVQGQPNPPLTATYWGFVAGDTPASLDTPVTLTTTAGTDSPPGTYPIIAGGATGTNYNITFYNSAMHIRPRSGGPGSLDLTFDPAAGGSLIGLAQGDLQVYALALQADGKPLIGGQFVGVDGVPRANLARLNLDGSLDRSFSTGVLFQDDYILYLAVQADDKILATLGRSVYRLNPDGTPDSQFAPDPADQGGVMCVQPDGKILISGAAYYSDDTFHSNYLDRLNPDGTRDGGFQRQLLPDLVKCLALQPDGKILAGGGLSWPGWLGRFNADGTPDGSFSATTDHGSVNAIAALPDGKVMVAGEFDGVNNVQRRGIARLNSDGSLDPSFCPTIVSFDPRVYLNAILPQPDGSVVVGGSAPEVYGGGYGYPGYPLLLKLRADGTEDPGFTAEIAGQLHYRQIQIRALAQRPDGRILAAGDLPNRGLMQVFETGSPDTDFRPNVQGAPGMADGITLQSDGKSVVQGSFSSVMGVARPGLARVNPDGTLDRCFAPELPADYRAVGHALQPDGKVIVATGHEPYLNGELIRLNRDGSRDPTYRPIIRYGTNTSHVTRVVVQPDGRALVAGYFDTVNGVTRSNLARLNRDGTLDVSFDAPLTGGAEYERINAIVLQPNGKILVGGWFAGIGGVTRHSVARLNVDGSVDRSFCVAYFESGENDYHEVTSLALQPDGRVLIGMGVSVWPLPAIPVIRVNPDGSTDSSFRLGTGVTAGTDFADINALMIQSDGKILVGGAFDTYDGQMIPNLVRLMPDGEVDFNFEVDWGIEEQGIWPSEIGEVRSLALQPDGKLLMAGGFKSIEGRQRWSLARLLNDEHASRPFVHREIDGTSVRLLAHPPRGTDVYTLEDQPPLGWSIHGLSHGGRFDSATGKVTFGPFRDGRPRTLGYQVTAPRGFSGVGYFVGTATANGLLSSISGDDRIVIRPRHPEGNHRGGQLSWVTHAPDGRRMLQLEGERGARYLIETSTNLVQWTALRCLTNDLGQVEVPESLSEQVPCRYYRARLIESPP